MRIFGTVLAVATLAAASCADQGRPATTLDGFDTWSQTVAAELNNKTLQAYEGAVTIVPTGFEYVILKEGDRDDRSQLQTYALVPLTGAPERTIVSLANAQVVRDKSGNVYIQDVDEPRAWRFSVRDTEGPVRFRSGVTVKDIRLFTSATSNTLPQNPAQLQAMRTVFASRAQTLGLSTAGQVGGRDDGDGGGGGPVGLVKCDCIEKSVARTCDAGGEYSTSCSTTQDGQSCTASCRDEAYSCCNFEY